MDAKVLEGKLREFMDGVGAPVEKIEMPKKDPIYISVLTSDEGLDLLVRKLGVQPYTITSEIFCEGKSEFANYTKIIKSMDEGYTLHAYVKL